MFKKSDSTIKDNQKNQRIQVFARTRPLSIAEIRQHSRSVLEVCSEKKEIRVRDGKMMNKAFAFDRVFGPETTQISVYQAVVGPLIQEVLMGYNCTVFAYGQTSTGKTFTMEGERSDKTCTWDEDPKAGIIPRSLHQLFEELYKEESVEFSVHVSFLELYNEELFDLLSPSDVQIAKLRLFEDSARKGSVVIQGLEEIKVNSKDEVYTILERGTVRRQTAATHLNASSSRSHTVFSVTVHIKENTIDGEELLKTGKLNLVDLAGSENIGRSGASQKTAREAGNINQSLLTLGRVITALVEKAPHVPYRESKLTRLLQDSLGGHTKTSIIATVSPASCNIEETISTLDYAQRAKSITIKPEVNQKMTKKALIKEYTEEIERLRKDLVATRDNNLGVFIHKDNYRAMEELKETNENLINKNKEILEGLTETQNALEDTKIQLDDTTNKYNESRAECEKLDSELSKTLKKLTDTQQALDETIMQRDEKQYIINVQSDTELKLTEQAQTLLEVANESTKNLSVLHDTVDRKNSVNEINDELSQEFQAVFKNKLSTMNEIISGIAQEQSTNLNSLEADICGILDSCQKYYSNFRNSFIEDFDMEFQKQLNTTTHIFLSSVEGHMNFCDDNAKKVSDLMFRNKQLSDGLKILVEKHSSMKEGWISLVSNLTQFLLDFRTQTKAKLQQLEEQVKSSSETHKELVGDLADMFKIFSLKQLEHSKWCDNQISALVAQKQNYSKKMDEKLQVIFSALTSIQDFKEEENQNVTSAVAEFYDAQSHNNRNIKTICHECNHKVEMCYEEEDIKSKGSAAVLRDIYMTYENQEVEVQNMCESVLSEQTNVDEEMTATFQSNENILNTQEHGLKYVKELITTGKRSLTENKSHYLQNVEETKEVSSSRISDMKLHVKVQEERLVPRFNSQLDLVSSTRKKIVESTDTLKNEFSNCSMQVKRFIEEELQRDVSTGNTPKRKCFVISNELAATSPHEIILERRRLQLDLEETSAAKNCLYGSSSDDSPQLKHRTNSKDTLLAPENYSSSDESTAFFSDTYSSQSDLTSESIKNKENQHSLIKKSKIPKKRTPTRKGSRTIRKPLSSSNVAIQD